jgi:poly-gamma-glutamate system protein
MKYNSYFYLAFLIALLVILAGESMFLTRLVRSDADAMRKAKALTEKWIRLVNKEKAIADTLPSAELSFFYNPNQSKTSDDVFIGDEYSATTTTLGSLDAKLLSNDLLLSSLIVRMINDSKSDTSKPVGVILSGSFPALSISVLAALQTLGRKAFVISSLGASSYGANQPYALWTDIERWLQEKGGMKFSSSIITYGAEEDTGGGLPDEAKDIFDRSLRRNHYSVFIPRDGLASLIYKEKFFLRSNIGLLLNIGGNQTALGFCSDAELIPNGLHTEKVTCDHNGKGLIFRLSEKGIPFIHLLNLKNLTLQYEITGKEFEGNDHPLFYESKVSKPKAGICLAVIGAIMYLYFRKSKKDRRNN